MTAEELARIIGTVIDAAEDLRPFLEVLVAHRDDEPKGCDVTRNAARLLKSLDALEQYASELKGRPQ